MPSETFIAIPTKKEEKKLPLTPLLEPVSAVPELLVRGSRPPTVLLSCSTVQVS